MKRAAAIAAFVLVGLTACGPPSARSEPPTSTAGSCPGGSSSPLTVVGVVTDTTRGSGFFVSPGIVVTAAHAVRQPGVHVDIPGIGARFASVVAADDFLDVAILRLELPIAVQGAVFSRAFPDPNSLVTVHFHEPQAGIADGQVLVVGQRPYGVQYLQADIPARPGMSGGPITDNCGSVIALAIRSFEGQLLGTLSVEILRMLKYEGVVGLERE